MEIKVANYTHIGDANTSMEMTFPAKNKTILKHQTMLNKCNQDTDKLTLEYLIHTDNSHNGACRSHHMKLDDKNSETLENRE